MHDKRIVNVNPEGQLNAVLRHAQINSFKLFHKQPNKNPREKGICYLRFSGEPFDQGMVLQ